MKKRIYLLFTLLLTGAMSLAGCSSSDNMDSSASTSTAVEQNESTKQTMSISDFENLLAEQPLYVSKTEYVVQSDDLKSLYPDMLRACITNNTTEDIKNAVVAFVAWDENNLPVKIKGQFDFNGDSYITRVNYTDINLISGDTFGEDRGYSLSENCDISSFKAIVLSFETFNGDTWENPYFDNFCTLYEGVKYSDDLTVDVKIVDSTFSVSENTTENSVAEEASSALTTEELEDNLSTLPVTIIKTKYVVQDDKLKSLYPDMLQAVLQNNTETDIKNAVVAFVAWDENNLPVKIEGQFDFNGGSYVKKVNYEDINLAAGDTFGENSGLSLNEHCNIETFKAIVVSYETFDGDTWDNPYFEDFCTLYEGKKAN